MSTVKKIRENEPRVHEADDLRQVKQLNHLQATSQIIDRIETSKENLEELLYELPEVLFIIDDKFRILKSNRSGDLLFEKISGTGKFRDFKALFSEEKLAEFSSYVEKLNPDSSLEIVSQIVFDLPLSSSEDRGEQVNPEIFFQWAVRLVPDVSRRRGLLYYVVAHDITDAKQLLEDVIENQKRTEAYNKNLELNLKTIANQKISLLESARLAQLGEMAGGIAHEINNPVAIIKGYSDVVKNALNGGEADKEFLLKTISRITLTADRIAEIVQSMRLLSRNSDNDVFREENIDELIAHSLVLFKEKVKYGEIDLRYDRKETGGTLLCRGPQIAQILTNLLINAYYVVMKLEDKWIKVDVEDDGTNVTVSITDSGERISDELIEKIMQPFFTTKPPGEGTGLGLSISNTIAEAHGGKFYIDRENPNTTFVLQLPKERQETEAETKETKGSAW